MYLINQLSKLTGLTPKALRYYDEQNILHPSFRNEENGYRMYDENDLQKAQLISLLRMYDFSIAEIKDALNVAEGAEDLTYIFKEKIESIEKNIAKEKAMIQDMKKQWEPIVNETGIQHYDITVEEIRPVTVASMRIKGKYDQVGHYIPAIYKEVKGKVYGNMFNCYYDESYVEVADIEICLPIRGNVSGKNVKCRTLPMVQAVCTTHYGSYKTLHRAYRELFRYVNENGIKILLPSREEYQKGPGMIFKGNTDKYVTKIILPFKKED